MKCEHCDSEMVTPLRSDSTGNQKPYCPKCGWPLETLESAPQPTKMHRTPSAIESILVGRGVVKEQPKFVHTFIPRMAPECCDTVMSHNPSKTSFVCRLCGKIVD